MNQINRSISTNLGLCYPRYDEHPGMHTGATRMHTGGARARSPICKPPPPACSQSDGACAHASDPRSLAEALSFSPLHFSKGPAWRAALVWFRAVCSMTILNASPPSSLQNSYPETGLYYRSPISTYRVNSTVSLKSAESPAVSRPWPSADRSRWPARGG